MTEPTTLVPTGDRSPRDGHQITSYTTDSHEQEISSTEEFLLQLEQFLQDVATGRNDFFILTAADQSYMQSCAASSLDGRIVIEWQYQELGKRKHFRLLCTAAADDSRLENKLYPQYSGDRTVQAFSVEQTMQNFISFAQYGIPEKGYFLEDMTAELFG